MGFLKKLLRSFKFKKKKDELRHQPNKAELLRELARLKEKADRKKLK